MTDLPNAYVQYPLGRGRVRCFFDIDQNGGNDKLVGGGGQDRLIGGRGANQFIFNRLNEGGDEIVDFNPRQDQNINREARLIYRPLSNLLLFDPDGSGSQAAKVLGGLTNRSMLNFDDISVQ